MMSSALKKRLQTLKSQFGELRWGKEALLKLIDEAEVPEGVYNSNAIENSTLTLKETEKILLEMEVSRKVSLREVFEAKNLSRVMQYMAERAQQHDFNRETILLLHQFLIGNIDESIAGRFRRSDEYVRVGTHVAPPPEFVEGRMKEILGEYASDVSSSPLDRIAQFHLDFEMLHPFNDGNGRIGRVLMNWQFLSFGLPAIIIRNKEKKQYYGAFRDYGESRSKAKTMVKILALAVFESLHKRIAYLKGDRIITLSDYAKKQPTSLSSLLNAARRQTIAAFREKGVWKIAESHSL